MLLKLTHDSAYVPLLRSIQIRNSIGKLQQIYVVVSTYRTDWDGDGYTNYSHPRVYFGLGLPTLGAYERDRLGFSIDFLKVRVVPMKPYLKLLPVALMDGLCLLLHYMNPLE